MNKNKIMWGVLLVLAAIILIVGEMGYYPEVNLFSIVATVILIGIIIKSIIKLSFEGILFPLAFICIINKEILGLTEISPWIMLFAALLGSIGLSMIFDKGSKKGYNCKWDSKDIDIVDIEDEGHVKFHTSFGGGTKYVNTDKFEQADLSCQFGGMEVYFDKAVMHNGKAVIRLDVSFSGVELYIPKEWTVVNQINVVLGGVEEKRGAQGEPDKVVTIIGNVKFAGVEIIYV